MILQEEDTDDETAGFRRFVPTFIRQNYTLKLAIAFVIILVAMTGIAGAAFFQTQSQLETEERSQLTAASETQADALGRWATQLRQEAQLLAESAAVKSDNLDRIQPFVTEKIQNDEVPKSVLAIHYLNLSGPRIEASSKEQFIGLNPVEEGAPFAQDGISLPEDGSVISDPFMGPKVNEPVVAVIAPVEGAKRAVIMMVNVKTRQESLPRQSNGTFTRVVNRDGQIVMDHNETALLTQHVGASRQQSGESTIVEQGLAGITGYTETRIAGQQSAVGYAPVPGVDWVVITYASVDRAFAVKQQVSRNFLLLLAAALVGLTLVAGLVYRGMIHDLTSLTTKAKRVEEGDFNVEFDTKRVDELGELYHAFHSTCETIRERIADAEAAREDAEEALAEAREANERADRQRQRMEARAETLESIAEQYRATLTKIADGDLRQRLDTDVEDDAMREVAEALNNHLDQLCTTIKQAHTVTRSVDQSTDEIATKAEEIETVANTVNETITDIASRAQEQHANIQEAVAEMTQVSATVQEVASTSDEVADDASEAATLAERGQTRAVAAVDDMEEIVALVETTVKEIETLHEQTEQIGEIVDLINDIADQTNTLALNASIEAARADGGDTGDGFAVVADEVKELAEETARRTGEIESRIAEIQAETASAVEDMRLMNDRIVEGSEAVAETGDVLADIVDRANEANAGIQSITDATDDQARTIELVVSTVEQVGEVSEQTVADTSDVASMTDQQTSAITAATTQITDLSEETSELRLMIDEFTLPNGRDDSSGSVGSTPDRATRPENDD